MNLKHQQIYEIGTKLLEPLTLEETYRTVVAQGCLLLNAAYGSIYLWENGTLQRMYSTLPLKKQLTHQKLGFIAQVFTNQKILIVPIQRLKKTYPQLKIVGLKQIIIVPLIYKNQSLGVLSLRTFKSITTSPKNKAVLKHLGSLVTLGIRKAQLYNDARRALKTRDEFIASVSHELKTPITALYGYAQLIRRLQKSGKRVKPAWIEALLEEVFRLTQLVNSLLQTSNAKKGEIEYYFKKCSIRLLIQTAIQIFTKRFPNHEIEFCAHDLPLVDWVLGDEERLVQVFINILTNAAQNTPSEKPITVDLSEFDHYLTVTISDKGRGIPQRELSQVFSKYYKRDTARMEGFGLSLYLAKKVLLRHQGSIVVDSVENGGTDVTISVPQYRK